MRLRPGIGEWVILIFAGIVTAGLNWPYGYVQVGFPQSAAIDSIVDFQYNDSRLPTIAGWPYRYRIEMGQGDGAVSRFSVLALTYNLGLAAVVTGALMIYLRYRGAGRRLGKRGGSVTIGDLLVATVILAGPFAYWRVLTRHRDAVEKDFILLREAGGGCVLQAWAPAVVENWLPEFLIDKLMRIRAVRLENPTDEKWQAALRCRDATTLRVGGDGYDLKSLQTLTEFPFLTDVRIAGRSIDGDILALLGNLKTLETINLAKTNVTAESLRLLADLPRVSRLGLRETRLRASDFDQEPWRDKLRSLHLPRPSAGQADELVIDGWPILQTLNLFDLDDPPNDVAMKVTVRHAPRLKRIDFDAFQKYDVELVDLPALEKLQRINHAFMSRLVTGSGIPTDLWFAGLKLDQLGSLESLTFHGVDTRSFRITGCPQLTYVIIAAQTAHTNDRRARQAIAPDVANAIITGIGQSDGPPSVSLSGMPLGEADLAPLADNRSIRLLNLSRTNTRLAQWKTLENMTGLAQLDVRQNGLDSDSLDWLTTSMPNLRVVRCGSERQDETAYLMGDTENDWVHLSLADRPKLKTFDMAENDWTNVLSVDIKNMPALEMNVKISDPLFQQASVRPIRIQNAPKLTGLSVAAPWHPQSLVDAIPGLRTFEAGGRELDDEVVGKLADSRFLDKLVLAHSSASPAALARLPTSQLGTLHLPGNQVTDEVVGEWKLSKNLQVLNLRQTQITSKGLAGLLRQCPNLYHLWVGDCPRLMSLPAEVANLTRLQSLDAAGSSIDAETLQKLLAASRIRDLDLSGSEVSADGLTAISKHAKELQRLGLRDNTLDTPALRQLLINRRTLRLDVEGSEFDTDLYAAVVGDRRIMEATEFPWIDAAWGMGLMMIGGQSQNAWFPSISVARFDPNSKMNQELQAMQAGPAVTIPPAAPPPPLATSVGRWLGSMFGAATGNKQSKRPETDKEEDEDSSDR